MTADGLEKIKADLAEALAQRPVISAQIAEAREKGDLSENAEYTEAKNKQSENETEIARLEDAIKNSIVVSEDEISTDSVAVGVTVRVRDQELAEEMEYTIVGVQESDPLSGRISDESPIGAGLLGAAVGDVRDIEVPSGAVLRLEILEIMR